MKLSLGGILGGQLNVISNLKGVTKLLERCQSDACTFVHEATVKYLKFVCITSYFGEVCYLTAFDQRLF